MITLFADGINTRFFTPYRGCRVFASAKSMVHEAGKFLGFVSYLDGNQMHVKSGGVTDIYLWKFSDGRKNEWVEFGA